jgi:hypothetical protein
VWQSVLINLATELFGLVFISLGQPIFPDGSKDASETIDRLIDQLEKSQAASAVHFFIAIPISKSLLRILILGEHRTTSSGSLTRPDPSGAPHRVTVRTLSALFSQVLNFYRESSGRGDDPARSNGAGRGIGYRNS